MKRRLYGVFTLFAIGVLLLTYSCKEKEEKSLNTSRDVKFTAEGQLSIFKDSSATPYSRFEIEIADNEYEIQTGMMYRKSLASNRGMLFVFPDEQMRYFYMKNTEISLDIIYLDKDRRIVSFQKNAKPLDETSLPSEAPAQYVFEIAGGRADELGMEVGDRIQYSTQ
jgi:uncharacterized membrane protein (UPF0127 family)